MRKREGERERERGREKEREGEKERELFSRCYSLVLCPVVVVVASLLATVTGYLSPIWHIRRSYRQTYMVIQTDRDCWRKTKTLLQKIILLTLWTAQHSTQLLSWLVVTKVERRRKKDRRQYKLFPHLLFTKKAECRNTQWAEHSTVQ